MIIVVVLLVLGEFVSFVGLGWEIYWCFGDMIVFGNLLCYLEVGYMVLVEVLSGYL